MAITLVNSVSAAGTNGATTASMDTSGATLLTMAVSYYSGHGSITISDSKGNTWIPLTERSGAGGLMQRMYYAENPIVGTSHTFTASGSLLLGGPLAQAWSGTATASVFGAEVGASTGAGTTASSGSITPAADNMLLLGFNSFGNSDSGVTWSSPLTGAVLLDATGSYFGINTAYEIQTTATARNPTVTGISNYRIVSAYTFKPASGGGVTNIWQLSPLGNSTPQVAGNIHELCTV